MAKITIDARLYGLENAGLGRYLINLVGELTKIDSENEYVILLRKKYFDTLNLPENWKKVLADIRHYSLAEQSVIPGIIKKEKPDITHFPHFNVPLAFKGKFVVTIHDMMMHESRGLAATTLPALLYFFKRLGYRLIFDNAVKRSLKILVPSQAVKDELLGEYKIDPDKIKVTYEGFDKRISTHESIDTPKPYFVFAGNAYPHKNLAGLIRAIKILNTKSDHKVFLAIASARNIFTQRIEKLILEIGAKDDVKILGFVPDEKLGNLFKGSVGFVFPSFSEGFGLPGLEALASGTLLLASNIKVFKEIYKDNALYFDPKNPESIAIAMNMALSVGAEERKNKISKSIQFIHKYSWTKMAEETLDMYMHSLALGFRQV
jgi:glycosyltransferase involved in cell wall biosynthesis